MSSIDLVLLGLLARQKRSAYDLAKEIERYDLAGVVRLSIPAIYKNVKLLEERRFLERRETRRGEMPEKTIYSLTALGRERFFALMEKCASEKVRYQFDFNPVILNLDGVSKKRRAKLLRLLKERLAAGREELESALEAWKEKSATAGLMLGQVESVSRALGEWFDEALKEA